MRRALAAQPPSPLCWVCSTNGQFSWKPIIGNVLAFQWKLDRQQLATINIQQGHDCIKCGQSLRVRALARAIVHALDADIPLASAVGSVAGLRVLEINPAGGLSAYLNSADTHQLTRYPEVNMEKLPFPMNRSILWCTATP